MEDQVELNGCHLLIGYRKLCKYMEWGNTVM